MGRFVRVAGKSDVGREREHNEDSFGVMQGYEIYLVADGMGGHKAGDVASDIAVNAVRDFFKATEKEDITWPFHFDPALPFSLNRLITAVQVANSNGLEKKQHLPNYLDLKQNKFYLSEKIEPGT